MTIDQQIEFWQNECKKMDKSDKKGLSVVDIMGPYSRLYHLCALKAELLLNDEKKRKT